MFSDYTPSGRQTPAKRRYVEGRRLESGGGGIEPPSEGSDRRIPEWPGVAKYWESR